MFSQLALIELELNIIQMSSLVEMEKKLILISVIFMDLHI